MKKKIGYTIFFAIESLVLAMYINREIALTIPPDVDSTVYLNSCYRLFECIYNSNWKDCITILTSLPNGGAVPLRVLMIYLLGYSRTSLILLNLIYYMALQFVGFEVFRRLNSIYSSWMFIGLLLSENVVFLWSGDLTSARYEFITFCTYGIWLLLSIYAIKTCEYKHFAISGIAAGNAIFCRFFTALIIALVIFFFVIIKMIKEKELGKYIKKVFQYVLWIILGGGWFFLLNIGSFFRYYFSAFSGPEASSWQMELSIVDDIKLSCDYSKYSIGTFGLIALGIVIIAVATGLVLKSSRIIGFKNDLDQVTLILLSVIVPFLLFTCMKNKQGLVYSVICAPVAILSTFLIKNFRTNIQYYLCMILFCIGLIIGLSHVVTKHSPHVYINNKDYYSVNERITEYMEENNKSEISVVYDRFVDQNCINTVQLLAYEKGLGTKDVKYAIDKINSNLTTSVFGEEELNLSLQNADIIVFNENGYESESPYLTNQLLDSYRAEIIEYSENNLKLLLRKKSGVCVYGRE